MRVHELLISKQPVNSETSMDDDTRASISGIAAKGLLAEADRKPYNSHRPYKAYKPYPTVSPLAARTMRLKEFLQRLNG